MSATNFNLRTDTFRSMKVVAPVGGYTAGQMVKVEDTIGVIVEEAAEGADAVLVYNAEKVIVPKETGQALSAGAKVYFDESENRVTSTSTDNFLCGRVVEAAASADTTVKIDLTGNAEA